MWTIITRLGETVLRQKKPHPPHHYCPKHGEVYTIDFSHSAKGKSLYFGPYCFVCWAEWQDKQLTVVQEINYPVVKVVMNE